MKKFLILLAILGVFLVVFLFFKYNLRNESIASSTAVSQTGRFSLKYPTVLILDKKASRDLINFIAYKDTQEKQILIGAIPNEVDLQSTCRHPYFLKNEKIADLDKINNPIAYLTINQHKGCIIDLDKNKSVLILTTPTSFINQGGEKINLVGLVSDRNNIHELKYSISFQITAKDFYINLVQLSQAFSPFSDEIDWHLIKKQGLSFIGEETHLCRGLSAAAKYLTPALHEKDDHTFVTLNGLGSAICPMPPIPKNAAIEKWLSVPEKTRNAIVKYTRNFHGYKITNRIAYIYIPSIEEMYSPNAINNKIALGREALKKANIDKSCGLIVDLRFNLGGSAQSMLLTLGGVIPSGHLFSLGKDTPVYLSKDGNKLLVGKSQQLYGQFNGKVPKNNTDKPVAILTNWMTASSGQLTDLALRNSSLQAKVFGGETSDAASVNATFYLADGNTLNLMVDRIYNRQGKMVPLQLPVDKEVEDNLETIFQPRSDVVLMAAKEWLESLPNCSN